MCVCVCVCVCVSWRHCSCHWVISELEAAGFFCSGLWVVLFFCTVFLRFQYLAQSSSSCAHSLCLILLNGTVSYTVLIFANDMELYSSNYCCSTDCFLRHVKKWTKYSTTSFTWTKKRLKHCSSTFLNPIRLKHCSSTFLNLIRLKHCSSTFPNPLIFLMFWKLANVAYLVL